MCRFLLAKTPTPSDYSQLLKDFVQMAKKSKTTEGDRQGDGWGYSWLDENNTWQSYHSLKPIWQDDGSLQLLPRTTQLIVHARSASFEHHKGMLSYNQPYLDKRSAFVFNGFVKGVRLNKPVSGKIGAQKIFNLILQNLQTRTPESALKKVHHLIKSNSKQVKGFNIGFSDSHNIYCLSDYRLNKKYFQLHYFNSEKIKIICSEQIGDFNWQEVPAEKVVIF